MTILILFILLVNFESSLISTAVEVEEIYRIMTSEKVAVVTGSNKGIGFAVVKGLCQKYDGIVYLTARDVAKGEKAVEELKKQGLNPRFHQLDISDQTSVVKFRDYINETHGGLDLLINNAAIKVSLTKPFAVQAEETIRVNYFGTLRVCETLFPLLRKNARVINVSSAFGFLRRIPSKDIRDKFSDPNLNVEGVTKLIQKYVEDAKAGIAEKEGWAPSCYDMSKIGISALSIAQQKMLDSEVPYRNIAVNHVHPGYVATDLTQHKGALTIEDGAKSTLYCALQADFKGKYVWVDCQVVDWYGETTPTPW